MKLYRRGFDDYRGKREVTTFSVDELIPYFIEFPKDKFCSVFDGLMYCYCLPPKTSFGDINIDQFNKIMQVVFKTPVDIVEHKFVNLKLVTPLQIYIGSKSDCDIQIDHPTVSERHAVINVVSSTEIWLTDLKSRFGTQLNDREVFPDIKTPVRLNDNINFGLVRSYLKTAAWVYSSLATRFGMRLNTDFERIVIRYFSGRIIKRIINDINIGIEKFTIRNALTNQFESFTMNDLKAIFWVKNLIGDPSRVDRQGFIKEADPSNMFLEFKDGECQWGSHTGYSPRSSGFFFYPHDPDSNNIKCYIPRDSLNYVLL
ncbi:MAG: FHA domain-containing protein [Deltaproteobacteria bacterium]|nr:FHA domain-containing protein [Deltaproteobacteria bacterium]